MLSLQKGGVTPGAATLTRIYGMCATSGQQADGAILSRVMRLIEEEGAGVVVLPDGLTQRESGPTADLQLVSRIFAAMEISETVLPSRDATKMQT